MELSSMDIAVYGFSRIERKIEEAGISYEIRIIRDKLILGLSTEPIFKQPTGTTYVFDRCGTLKLEEPVVDQMTAEDFMDPDDECYLNFLNGLDPKHCKNQDHYRVLGLSKLRWQATVAQIRTAYRAKVLKYHPDKKVLKKAEMNSTNDYFTCITKAYEQLGVSQQKRRAYDSVDPIFDDSIPDEKKISSDNFFDILGPVFLRNARWSNRQPVPSLGDMNSGEDEVDIFYSFWFEWDSWREFSYLDEEDKEKATDRWERREMEKTNKAERERRRKNEMKRIRNLVEVAYRKDPRIVVFKEREKLRKERQKDERKKMLEEKRAEQERKRMEIDLQNKRMEEEQLEKERRLLADGKRLKEQQKKQLGEARRKLRRIAESKKYWDAEGLLKLSCLEAIERVCIRFGADRLNEITAEIESVSSFAEAMNALKIEVDEVRENVGTNDGRLEHTVDICHWAADELSLLIKATTLYPVGTVKRWLKIANYINEHRENKNARKKTEKDVLMQVKELNSLKSVQDQKKIKDILVNCARSDEVEWSAEEQKLLEAALKKYPSSDLARWDNIANYVGKSKKDCIRRFRYLAEMVRGKREQFS